MYYLTKVVILFSLFNSRTVTNHCSTQYIFRRAIFRGWFILKDFDLRVRISWVSSTQKTINSKHPSVQHKKFRQFTTKYRAIFVRLMHFCWTDDFFVLNSRVCWKDVFCVEVTVFCVELTSVLNWRILGAEKELNWRVCYTEGDPYIENFSKNVCSPYYEWPESDILLSKIFGRTQFQIFLRFSRLRVKWFGLE